ncbi:hypothetical protein BD779DRAFT_1499298, partial [Infundibulicybe gibba]
MTTTTSTRSMEPVPLLEQLSLDEETTASGTRNVSPITMLFPELLAAVFAFCICPRLSSVQCIAQVSRHWREVALAFPNLWSTITIRDTRNPVWSEEIFRRSKAAHLSIYFGYGAHGLRNKLVTQVLGQIQRIKEMHIKKLTRLRIVAESSISPSLSHLVGALRRMPFLEELELTNCLPSNIHPERLHLPHLSLLHISSTVTNCANLLWEISLPHAARIITRCSGLWKEEWVCPLLQLYLTWFYLEGDIADGVFDMVYPIINVTEVTDVQVTHEPQTWDSQVLRSLVDDMYWKPFPFLCQHLERNVGLAPFLKLEELSILTRRELLDEDYRDNLDQLGDWLGKHNGGKECATTIVERDLGKWEWAVAWKYSLV